MSNVRENVLDRRAMPSKKASLAGLAGDFVLQPKTPKKAKPSEGGWEGWLLYIV